MPDNERDQIIEQVAHVLIDVATEDVTADAYDMARALDHDGLLRTGDDTGEVAKLRTERDQLQRSKTALIDQVKRLQDQVARAAMEPGQDRQAAMHAYAADRDRAVAETAALRDDIRALADKWADSAFAYAEGSGYRLLFEQHSGSLRALDGGQS